MRFSHASNMLYERMPQRGSARMNNPSYASVYLRDPRLAPHIAAAAPAWLWNTSGTHIIWANATAAAIFGAATVGELITRTFDSADAAAAQIVRLAALLPHGATPRVEQLRGFGGGPLHPTVCACSRIEIEKQVPAILVVGQETIEPPLPLSERLRRLFDGTDQSIAVFTPDGVLAYATPRGYEQIGNAWTLADLDADPLTEEALRVGWPTGIIARGRVILDRIGDGANALIVATFTTPGARAAPPFMPLADAQDRQQPAPVASAQNVVPFRPVTTVTD